MRYLRVWRSAADFDEPVYCRAEVIDACPRSGRSSSGVCAAASAEETISILWIKCFERKTWFKRCQFRCLFTFFFDFSHSFGGIYSRGHVQQVRCLNDFFLRFRIRVSRCIWLERRIRFDFVLIYLFWSLREHVHNRSRVRCARSRLDRRIIT